MLWVLINEYPQYMFLWRNMENNPYIIAKYPPYMYLFYWEVPEQNKHIIGETSSYLCLQWYHTVLNNLAEKKFQILTLEPPASQALPSGHQGLYSAWNIGSGFLCPCNLL